MPKIDEEPGAVAAEDRRLWSINSANSCLSRHHSSRRGDSDHRCRNTTRAPYRTTIAARQSRLWREKLRAGCASVLE